MTRRASLTPSQDFFALLVVLFSLFSFPDLLLAQARRHEIHFQGTPYELHVFRLEGRETTTPKMLIIGGIQGDEPGGFLAADRYVDLTLKRGTLIVVPRANFRSIIKNQRGPDGDMNRRFRVVRANSPMDLVVEVLKGLMEQADIFLNLHDGSGFFSPRWESPQRNPMRFGQSIIADASEFFHHEKGRTIALEPLATRVIQKVNSQIHDERHHFHFNNHRTLDRDTPHKEQRSSATFYALTKVGIPAFGVETSKDIPDPRTRVQYQTMVINAFMEEVGIVPDHPPLALDPPQLHYLIVSVNGNTPLAVPNNETLHIGRGDSIEVKGIVANYQRGITADVVGYGSENDLNRPLKVRKDTTILVRKESQVFGHINVRIREGIHGRAQASSSGSSAVSYFLIEVEGEKRLVENGGTLKVTKGDALKLVDVLPQTPLHQDLHVNFLGFVPDGAESPGEDRGLVIHTGRDLNPQYALDASGDLYRVVALEGQTLVGEIFVELESPQLHCVVTEEGEGHPLKAYLPGGVISLGGKGQLRIFDVLTSVPGNKDVELEVRGSGYSLEPGSQGWILKAGPFALSQGQLVVTRRGTPLGTLTLSAR